MLAAHRFIPRPATSIITPVDAGVNASGGRQLGTSISSGAAFTPPANTLILVVANWHGNSTNTVTTGISDTIGGLTWHELTNGWHANTQGGSTRYAKSSVFWAITGASPPSGTITISVSAVGGMGFEVLWIPSANTASPIGNVGYASLQGTFGSTISIPNSVTSSGAKFILSCFASGLEGGSTIPAPTKDAAFTSLFVRSPVGGSHAVNIACAYNKSGVVSDTWQAVGTNGYQFWWDDVFLIEINE